MCKLKASQHIASQLCVSMGRAITIATPSNEYLLKGWAPLSLSFICTQAIVAISPRTVSWGTERMAQQEDFLNICSAALFTSFSLPLCFWSFRDDWTSSFCYCGISLPTRTSLWLDTLTLRCCRCVSVLGQQIFDGASTLTELEISIILYFFMLLDDTRYM